MTRNRLTPQSSVPEVETSVVDKFGAVLGAGTMDSSWRPTRSRSSVVRQLILFLKRGGGIMALTYHSFVTHPCFNPNRCFN